MAWEEGDDEGYRPPKGAVAGMEDYVLHQNRVGHFILRCATLRVPALDALPKMRSLHELYA